MLKTLLQRLRILKNKKRIYWEAVFDQRFMDEFYTDQLKADLPALRVELEKERAKDKPSDKKIAELSEKISEGQSTQQIYSKTKKLISEMDNYIKFLTGWKKEN